MHNRAMKEPYRRHTVEHHEFRKAPGKFFVKEDDPQKYDLIETSFMPKLWLLHTPFFYLVYRLCGMWACLGVAGACACYVLAYEVLHWSIHYPDKFPLKHHKVFLFLTQHHRIHHRYYKVNFNVVFPLADWWFGTLSYREVPPEPEQLEKQSAATAFPAVAIL